MRFGVFWRTLKFDLKEAGNIINSAALLHNFILEERMMDNINSQHRKFNDEDIFRTFSTTIMNYLDESMEVGAHTPRDEAPLATVSDNNEPAPTRRHSQQKLNNKAAGKRLRDWKEVVPILTGWYGCSSCCIGIGCHVWLTIGNVVAINKRNNDYTMHTE